MHCRYQYKPQNKSLSDHFYNNGTTDPKNGFRQAETLWRHRRLKDPLVFNHHLKKVSNTSLHDVAGVMKTSHTVPTDSELQYATYNLLV